jgi:membrane protease YdiL (CAAX protease family)
MIIPIFYLVAIAGAELVTALVNPLGGIAMHIVIMLALIVHASLITRDLRRELYLTLALAPMIRLLSLSMPLGNFPQIYWYAIIAVPLSLAIYVVARRLGYTRWEIGINLNQWPFQILIALTGIPLGIVEYYILKPNPLVSSFAWQGLLLPALILIVGTGFIEELCFRGVIQHSAEAAIGRWGWIYVAVLFSIMHIGYLSILDLAFVFGVGLFFGIMVDKTKSILGVTLSHGIANVVLYLIVPFFL